MEGASPTEGMTINVDGCQLTLLRGRAKLLVSNKSERAWTVTKFGT